MIPHLGLKRYKTFSKVSTMLKGFAAVLLFLCPYFTLAFFINSSSKYLWHAFVCSAFPSFVQFIPQVIRLYNLIFIKHHHLAKPLIWTVCFHIHNPTICRETKD
jgi:hypothetical protein